MNDRKGYYVKPGKRVSAPASLFTIVVNPLVAPAGQREDLSVRSWGDAHVCHSMRRGNRWSKATESKCETPSELWAWMYDKARKDRRNYVVAPSASEVLTLADWWGDAEAGGVAWAPHTPHKKAKRKHTRSDGVTRVRRYVARPTVDLIDYSCFGYRWLWVSGHQYFQSDEEELAKAVGWKWPETEMRPYCDGKYVRTVAERSKLWLRVMQRLSDWWQKHARAPWGFTAGQLSMGILRTHIKPKALCTHNDPDAHLLERQASFGGRCSTWYYGDIGHPRDYTTIAAPAPFPGKYGSIPGPILQLDVQSMYPAILAREFFPVKHYSYRVDPPASEPQALAHSFGVIAHVTIETDTPEYPVRRGGDIHYPVGRFQTTLTGPELLALRRDGKVVRCHRMMLYDMGRPFREAAEAMLRLREDTGEYGDDAWKAFAKLIACSLGGKLAQRRGEWQERRKVAPAQSWGEWTESSGKGGIVRRYRAVAGLVWEYVRDSLGAGPFTFAFAYLTAYGRLQMRRIREKCPAESVISQDTDGLWVTRPAAIALTDAKLLAKSGPGKLSFREEVPSARFFAPRHYWTPGEWTLAGFRHGEYDPHTSSVTSLTRLNPLHWSATEAPTATFLRQNAKKLAPELRSAELDQWGWAHPKYLS